MNAELAPYPSYKPSRLPWLGAIPAHWQEQRAKYLIREVDDRTPTGAESLLSMRQARGLVPHNDVSAKQIEPRHLVGYRRVQPGDLVVNRMRAAIGLVAAASSAGLVSPDYAVFRPIVDVSTLYLSLLFKTPAMQANFWAASKGLGTGSSGFLRLYSDALVAMPILVPPPAEQGCVITFVQAWDRQFSRFIRAKQRLIALLNEQQQAIIERAVTRGVDAGARLAPSGVAWLGDVPAHWTVKALKQVADVRLSGVDKLSVEGEAPVRLCNYTDVYNHDVITSGLEFMPATATAGEIASFTLRKGDVLITKDSEMWDDIAVPALVAEDLDGVLCGYHLALIRPDPAQAAGEFLFRAFTAPTLARQFHVAATGVTRYGIAKHAIKNAVIPMPHPEEQARICRWIASALGPLAAAEDRARTEIALVREYRARLIADVVTGKLDVRRIAPEAAAMVDGEAEPEEVEAALADEAAEEGGELDGVEDAEEGEG